VSKLGAQNQGVSNNRNTTLRHCAFQLAGIAYFSLLYGHPYTNLILVESVQNK